MPQSLALHEIRLFYLLGHLYFNEAFYIAQSVQRNQPVGHLKADPKGAGHAI